MGGYSKTHLLKYKSGLTQNLNIYKSYKINNMITIIIITCFFFINFKEMIHSKSFSL